MSTSTHYVAGLPNIAERHSLRKQVADALRTALLTGKMRPGTIYSAPTLAEEFGVSATPVREAMIDLANDGLIEAVRNRGFRVVSLYARDIDELAEMRELLEVPALARLAGAVAEEDAATLRVLAEETVAEAMRGDLLGYAEAEGRFHTRLLSLNGNRLLVKMVHDLCTRSHLYGLAKLPEAEELVPCALEHTTLLDALIAGDAARAEEVMRRHIGRTRDWAHEG